LARYAAGAEAVANKTREPRVNVSGRAFDGRPGAFGMFKAGRTPFARDIHRPVYTFWDYKLTAVVGDAVLTKPTG
jgi:hypothetical protein